MLFNEDFPAQKKYGMKLGVIGLFTCSLPSFLPISFNPYARIDEDPSFPYDSAFVSRGHPHVSCF